MATIPVFRLRALDRELAEILAEADSRCAVEFSLRLDEMREKLIPTLTAIGNSEARMMRRHADRDESGRLHSNEHGGLRFSNPEKQEQLSEEMTQLAQSTIDFNGEAVGRISKAELIRNGLAVSGQRLANLRPILDLSVPDEPIARPASERTVFITHPRELPHA